MTSTRVTVRVASDLGFPVEGGDQPRHAETEEHVDRVGPGHVSDRVVGGVVHGGRLLAGEQIGQTGTERHERDGRHAVLQSDQAAEDSRQVADDRRQQADQSQRHEKRQPAVEK